jgi:2-polyprenyl-3-methyl-5-hydroxy-6-metoxy-1,4-benzoquinol methylase
MAQEYFGWARDEMRPFLPARCGKVLEIGCGAGRFSGGIADAAEIWGIEPDAGAAEAARSRLGRVINTEFDAALGELPPHYFDTVICNDVIEHMPDHDWFLETIKTVMSPAGVLVGSIPNVRYYRNLFDLVLTKDWEYQDQGILDRTHLRFFTEKSLRRTLRSHGFRIEEMRGINGGISRQAPAKGIVACAAIVLSLGYFRDIRHLQFAFRASVDPDHPPPPAGVRSASAKMAAAC